MSEADKDKVLDQLLRRTHSALGAALDEALDYGQGLSDIQERSR